jgi:class 3 adenylate cyclase/putative methionine-R-sulfoxide reductase with GAF domain
MKRFSRLRRWLFKPTSLHYKLHLIVGLFFLFPVLGFLYFAVRHDFLQDAYLPLFFLGLLTFSLLGILILRRLFDEIAGFSRQVADRFESEEAAADPDELHGLVHAFSAIERKFSRALGQLEKKSTDIAVLKELSDLCYVTFDPEEILYVTLERALVLTGSEIGSILILERGEPKTFVVKACIGLGEHVRIGDRLSFDQSVAKYAVINKSPLIVEDIERDTRFGRANRPHYGTKSFVCMPIKTSKDIVGVLTISRKNQDRPYTSEDVEVLIPLLSNAAFTYENLRLIRDNARWSRQLRTMEKVFGLINSSFRGRELIGAVLGEIQAVLPFAYALILLREPGRTHRMVIHDMAGTAPAGLVRGGALGVSGSAMERVLGRKTFRTIEDTRKLDTETDRSLLPPGEAAAGLLAPLTEDGSAEGVLVMGFESAADLAEAPRVASWVAGGVSLAVERDRMSAGLVRRERELDSIRQIGRALASSTFDTRKVLSYTMDMIRMLINAEGGALFQVEGDEIVSAALFNIDLGELEAIRLRMGQGVAGTVAARGEPLIVNDPDHSPHFHPQIDRDTGFQTRSILCVPMISQGKVIGVIEVLNKLSGDFTLKDRDLLVSIAASVSIAVENARLYKETVAMAEHERGIRGVFQKFVPRQILDQILHGAEGGQTGLNELKTLTLLNIDIRKSSDFVRRVGPQKTVALLNHFFSVMGEIVFARHGVVDKYLGDGFLAIFGAPVSSTRDAENAVIAALEMKNAMARVNDHCREAFGETVTMGISVHTGEMVVGNIGFEMKMDYTVIGDPVNIVFRLQERTRPYPDGILVTENVHRAALSRLEVEPAPEPLAGLRVLELKGRRGGG